MPNVDYIREPIVKDPAGFPPDLVSAIQRFPADARYYDAVSGALKAAESKAAQVAARNGGVLPADLMAKMRDARGAATRLGVAFFSLRDAIRAGVAKARAAGKLDGSQTSMLQSAGLAGLRGRRGVAGIRIGGGGLGFFAGVQWPLGPGVASSGYGSGGGGLPSLNPGSINQGPMDGLGALPLLPIAVVLIILSATGVALYAVHQAFLDAKADYEDRAALRDAALAQWSAQSGVPASSGGSSWLTAAAKWLSPAWSAGSAVVSTLPGVFGPVVKPAPNVVKTRADAAPVPLPTLPGSTPRPSSLGTLGLAVGLGLVAVGAVFMFGGKRRGGEA